MNQEKPKLYSEEATPVAFQPEPFTLLWFLEMIMHGKARVDVRRELDATNVRRIYLELRSPDGRLWNFNFPYDVQDPEVLEDPHGFFGVRLVEGLSDFKDFCGEKGVTFSA